MMHFDFKEKLYRGTCVYCLWFIQEPQKRYYGSTTFFYGRIRAHIRNLINKKHPNKNLQGLFDAYGCNSFRYAIIEKVKGKKIAHKKEVDLILNDKDHVNIHKNKSSKSNRFSFSLPHSTYLRRMGFIGKFFDHKVSADVAENKLLDLAEKGLKNEQ